MCHYAVNALCDFKRENKDPLFNFQEKGLVFSYLAATVLITINLCAPAVMGDSPSLV